jgi:hypothetical protein
MAMNSLAIKGPKHYEYIGPSAHWSMAPHPNSHAILGSKPYEFIGQLVHGLKPYEFKGNLPSMSPNPMNSQDHWTGPWPHTSSPPHLLTSSPPHLLSSPHPTSPHLTPTPHSLSLSLLSLSLSLSPSLSLSLSLTHKLHLTSNLLMENLLLSCFSEMVKTYTRTTCL